MPKSAWRERNADRVREYNKAYWARNKERLSAATAEWRAANPERVAAYKETQAKQVHKRERRQAYARDWYRSPRGRAKALVNSALHRAKRDGVPFDITA